MQNVQFVARSLRRLGVREDALEDAVQEVLLVADRKLEQVEVGKERPFLYSVALRVASHARRSQTRRTRTEDALAAERSDTAPTPEELSQRWRARRVLDQVLDALPEDLRAVFCLYELEELATADIAQLLDIPQGTVKSRLLRARLLFEREVERQKRLLERDS
jgi:RNA polymerase sigma-70 factor (ECF subfamily)